MDFYPTILELIGATDSLPKGIEGASLVPLLFNGGEFPPGMNNLVREYGEQGELYFHWPHNFGVGPSYRIRPKSAIRDGNFKLVRQYGENGTADEIFLFDLTASITESESVYSQLNLAPRMPAKAAEMLDKLNRWLAAVDASLPYDVAAPVELEWDGGHSDIYNNQWHTTNDVKYLARETWELREGQQRPLNIFIDSALPGLPQRGYAFDGEDGMTRKFFHVADWRDRMNTINAGVPDFDLSMTVEAWIRLDTLAHEQLLLESGDKTAGFSITIGDADNDNICDDVRFRVLGHEGNSLTVTAPLGRINTEEFVQLVTVLSDEERDQYAEIYINGALAARTDGTGKSYQWDKKDDAGLGFPAGSGVGGNSGTGPLPFTDGNFEGQLASLQFCNYPCNPDVILWRYNTMSEAVNHDRQSNRK